jgi:hypothetical protein
MMFDKLAAWLVFFRTEMAKKRKNPAAVTLGKLGGKARAAKMTPEELSRVARKGGLARVRKLSHSELRRIALLGVAARRRKREEREGK